MDDTTHGQSGEAKGTDPYEEPLTFEDDDEGWYFFDVEPADDGE